MIEFKTRPIETGDGRWIITPSAPAAFQKQVDQARAKHDGFILVKIEQIKNRRTTGPFSQNHHINGHANQLAAELGYTFDAMKMEMKRMAISQGWPYDTMPSGQVWPASEGDERIDTAAAAALIETMHQFAAEYGIILKEETVW